MVRGVVYKGQTIDNRAGPLRQPRLGIIRRKIWDTPGKLESIGISAVGFGKTIVFPRNRKGVKVRAIIAQIDRCSRCQAGQAGDSNDKTFPKDDILR